MNIFNSYFEDDNKDIHFFYTGKDTVSGITYPDNCITNNNYPWMRVAFAKIVDVTKTSMINEEIDIRLISNDAIGSFKVQVKAAFSNGRIVRDNISSTLTKTFVDDTTVYDVVVTEDSYKEGAITKYGLGIWVKTEGISNVTSTVLHSLGDNQIPLDNDSIKSYYESSYLSASTIEAGVNTSSYTYIEPKIINTPLSLETTYENRLQDLETRTKNIPWEYIQNTVQYSTNYSPSAANTIESISPTTVSSSTNETISRVDLTNKCVRVTKPGMYLIQVRQGFKIATGTSNIDLAIYKNTTKINELTVHDVVDSSGRYSSSMTYICHLALTDALYLKAKWSDANINIEENNSLLTISALSYD